MMDNKEQEFTHLVREHKSTIYSVCYMFSKDTDEIDDLFQEILIRLWKGYDSFRAELMWRRGILVALLCVGTLALEYYSAKRLLNACDDIIERLRIKDE
jgi:hypothetical protein